MAALGPLAEAKDRVAAGHGPRALQGNRAVHCGVPTARAVARAARLGHVFHSAWPRRLHWLRDVRGSLSLHCEVTTPFLNAKRTLYTALTASTGQGTDSKMS
jgi:hypothetical protein